MNLDDALERYRNMSKDELRQKLQEAMAGMDLPHVERNGDWYGIHVPGCPTLWTRQGGYDLFCAALKQEAQKQGIGPPGEETPQNIT